MPAQQLTMTAPRAIIKVDGKAVGLIRNLRTTETIQRGSVMGLGRLTKKEMPALSITCTWSCDQYLINLKDTGIPGLNNREINSPEKYKDTLILAEIPIDIVVAKREASITDANGIVTTAIDGDFATLKDVYLNSSSWDVTENQISAHNQSGEYLEPILLPQ